MFGGIAAANHSSFAHDSRTIVSQVVDVAELLRRWTRNSLGSPRVGSNPTDYVHCLVGENASSKEVVVLMWAEFGKRLGSSMKSICRAP